MPANGRIAVRLAAANRKPIDRLAAAHRINRSVAVNEALDQYLVFQQWQIERIRESIRQAGAGAIVDHGDIATWAASWAGTHERPMPEIR